MMEVELDFSNVVLLAAAEALDRGWAPLPLPAGSKAPDRAGWTAARFNYHELAGSFFGGDNLGLLLGAASNNLVDVDLDTPEACRLAQHFLPRTGMTHGRPSSPYSHFWYYTDTEAQTVKYQDPTDRAVLLEIRSTGSQTMVPPSVHPSGEHLSWEGRNPGHVNRGLLVTRCRHLAAASVLAKHWPASGGRHDASLALAGGLLRAGWTLKATVSFVLAVSVAVDPSVDRQDRANAVRSTYNHLRKDEDAHVRGWPSLAEDVGEKVVSKVREWLIEEPETDDSDEVMPVTRLGAYIRGDIEPPPWLVEDVLYKSKIHWVAGEPGGGKTFVALGLAVNLMRVGHTVLWVDEEAGPHQTALRLKGMGADEIPGLDDLFKFVTMTGFDSGPRALDALIRKAEEFTPSMIVFDSAMDMLSQAGADEDSNTEVTGWIKTALEPMKQRGAAVVVLDHVTKSRDNRGSWARGAGAKKAKSDVLWKFSQTKEFNEHTVGFIEMERGKDRDGRLPKKVVYRIGGQDGRIVFDRQDAVDQPKVPESDLGQRVARYLQANARGSEEALSTAQVCKEVTGRNEAVTEELSALLKDPTSGVRSAKHGTARLWWIEQYTDVDFTMVE